MSDFKKLFYDMEMVTNCTKEEIAEKIYLGQQQKIDKLKEENQVLRDSYNSLVSDMTNGEHIDFSWVRSAIDSAAVDMITLALQEKLYRVENRNLKLESLLKEACSFVEYAEKNKYKNTGFSKFLNKPEIKKIRGEEV